MKKTNSQQLFNNRPLGEVSSQASLNVGFVLEFLLNFSDSILASLSGDCTVDWAFSPARVFLGWPQLLQCLRSQLLWQQAEVLLLAGSSLAPHKWWGWHGHHNAGHGSSAYTQAKEDFPYSFPIDFSQDFSLFL